MTNDINEKIKEYRIKAKISKRKMAELLGMKYSEYSCLEREGDIRAQMVLDIAYRLGIEPSKLVISGMMAEYENIANQKTVDKFKNCDTIFKQT